jgi:predicted O-methyltransferase YrrM
MKEFISKIKISKKSYWDDVYESINDSQIAAALDGYWRKKMFALLARYLPRGGNKKFIEIGGAPGTSAILFNKFFQYDSYVVDYSEVGIEKTKNNFRKMGLSDGNVILKDSLSEEFLSKYEGEFDVVLSDGFIEHFKEPLDILKTHLKILKKGGFLIVIIPVNNFILKLQPFFKKGVVDQYNAPFMNIEEFQKIFLSQKDIEINYLNYFGGINLAILVYANFFVRKIMYGLQKLIEIIKLDSIIPLNKHTSPYIICVAKKIS